MDGQIFPSFWGCICLDVHGGFLKWLWQDSREGGLGPCWGIYSLCWKRTELEWSIEESEARPCFLKPASLSSHNQILSSSKPSWHATSTFIYSLIHSFLLPLLLPFSNYEHLLWASTVPDTRIYQRARGKWSLLSDG